MVSKIPPSQEKNWLQPLLQGESETWCPTGYLKVLMDTIHEVIWSWPMTLDR